MGEGTRGDTKSLGFICSHRILYFAKSQEKNVLYLLIKVARGPQGERQGHQIRDHTVLTDPQDWYYLGAC